MVLFVLVGFASFNGKGGQWMNMEWILDDGHRVLCVDPMHKEESDEYIEGIVGVKVRRMEGMEILPYCVNIVSVRIEDIGELIEDREFMVVLSCRGDMSMDSSDGILKEMGIRNPNAYAFGLGCFALPPKLGLLIDLEDKVDMGMMYELEQLQRLWKLLLHNGKAFYRANRDGKVYDWFSYYLDKLEMESKETVAEQYEKLCLSFGIQPDDANEKIVEDLIMDELKYLDLDKLWGKRNYN